MRAVPPNLSSALTSALYMSSSFTISLYPILAAFCNKVQLLSYLALTFPTYVRSSRRVSVKFPFSTASSNSGRKQKPSFYNSVACFEVCINQSS